MIMKVFDDFIYSPKELDLFCAINYHKRKELSAVPLDVAPALYQTMLPEISARRSLLEPSLRYLSPGSEGDKYRPN